ncbi:hypothetical protein ZIOFF_013279 [Zingiber officinale]|uniref:Pentatricopeptide repeat-containing protein n=1 Tax=Zingiber officinale TaxID=94328 RepID=A0A8J5HFU4_ZINOF|nr:hypothetical protein ZIOFF_013279 [Zingiber officinale]
MYAYRVLEREKAGANMKDRTSDSGSKGASICGDENAFNGILDDTLSNSSDSVKLSLENTPDRNKKAPTKLLNGKAYMQPLGKHGKIDHCIVFQIPFRVRIRFLPTGPNGEESVLRLTALHRRHASSSYSTADAATAVDCDGGVGTRSDVKHLLTEKPSHNASLRELNYQLRSLLGFASPGLLSAALSFLRGMLSADSTSPPYAATRSIQARGGATSGAWDFFHAVKDAGGSIEAPVCNALLTGLAAIQDFTRMNLLFSEMKVLGVRPIVVTFGALINHLCKSHRLDDALNMLDAMSSPDSGVSPNTIIFNTLIDELCKAGRIQDGLSLLDKMKSSHVCDPDSVTYNSLIDAFCKAAEFDMAHKLLTKMEKERVAIDVVTLNAFVNGMCRHGRATALFDEMIKQGVSPDSMTYCTHLWVDSSCGFCKKKRLDKAFEIHDEMCKVGLRPDIFTYTTLIDAFCKASDFSKADKFLAKMVDDGCKPNVVTYGAMINGLYKAGDLDQAMKIFRSMDVSVVLANVIIYTILIDSYCKNQKVDAATDLFDEMQKQDILPNVKTYTSIFKGFKDHNMSDKAFELMDKMNSQGCKPNYMTMNVLTGWLTAIGETERLRLFVQRMTASDIDLVNPDV